MNLQKKVLIAFKVDNVIDVITNSSSELFVLKGETLSIVKEMVSNVYPEYLNEYAEPKSIEEMTNEEIDDFVSWHGSAHMWPATKAMMPVLEGFEFDEMYEPKKNWQTGLPEGPAWNGEIQYQIRNNLVNPSNNWESCFVTDENRQRVINAISKTVGNFFMYSLDENPDWDMQEQLMLIGERYHLG